jgi:hypothetical protein
MEDYTITISIGENQYSNKFRYDHISYEWTLFRGGSKSAYTIKMYEDNDMTYYDLCKNNEPIKMFDFEMGGFGNTSNLLEVLTYIIRYDSGVLG